MKTPTLHSQISWLHIIVIVLSFVMTITVWQYSKSQTETKVEQRFEASRDRVISMIQDRMKKYEDALWAGVSALESHDAEMRNDQWRAFADNMRIEEKYPGINGIGVIHYLNSQSLGPYLEQHRAERPDFNIHPAHDQSILMPITFIEPEAPNVAAVGLDIAHEVNRRTAALASRDTGNARITGPIVLVQDAGSTPGFLFYAPFYRDYTVATVEERQDQFAGAVYSPFVVLRLMQGVLAKDLRGISISISDAEELIYNEHLESEELHDPNPLFAQTVTIDMYGRQWALDIRSNLAFRLNNTYTQPTIIFIGGLLIEALIISLMIMMSRANSRAVSYAEHVTDELRQEKEKLVKSNVELEQFAYVISHDLKTPIRGISGLTEMLKEDLEGYFAAPDADPEIANVIGLIQDRVQRMNDLTSGILEFSCVRDSHGQNKPMDLHDTIKSLLSDFSLKPGQLLLETPVDTVYVDTINLRRVLENLIGNSVKYHDGVKPLRILVTVAERGNSLQFTVSDNGPGIDPRFENKIFQMFQTLRTGDAPESTGIGLAVVKKSVEMHGGDIRLIAPPGGGAAFTFEWPNDQCSPAEPLTSAAAA